jgi:outer membrane protein OmpA-like peptidoglycan-associated protein
MRLTDNICLKILISWLLALCFHTAIGQSVINKEAIAGIRIFNETNINTANLESSPAFVGDKIGFVYAEIKGKLFDKEIDESYFDLGYSIVNTDNSLGYKTAYNNRINSELHEGPMCYDVHENKLFFTRSHKETRRLKGIDTDTFYLRIMSADLNVAKPVVNPININVENYSVCHPALTSDGKTMVFSSNKPGGMGKMDIYIAYFNGEEWTGVINIGAQINTSANEVFPTIMNDSILLFASDRSGGSGGLDIYVSLLKNGIWASPEIMPAPFNSPFDDLGLIVRENGKSGYFTSSRPGGKGKDDIYRFESLLQIFGNQKTVMATSEILVLDKLTLSEIPNASITLTPLAADINNFTLSSYNVDLLSGRDPGDIILKLSPKKGQTYPVFFTNEDGRATFQIKKEQKYLIKVTANGFSDASLIFDYTTFGASFNMVMEPLDDGSTVESENFTESTPDTSIGKPAILTTYDGAPIILENIYYDYNKTAIQPGAAKELDMLALLMTEHPKLKIRLESHTDCRGTSIYNLQLSIDRANSARKYLTDLGVDEDRILIKGFGESRLRNECRDNIPCSETKHRYNRRTEVVIMEE